MLLYLLRRFALAGLMLFGLICLTFTIANIARADSCSLRDLDFYFHQSRRRTNNALDGNTWSQVDSCSV